ncbi:hypothetical protein QCA50_011010 [Cerrena zonata]|uniref:Uncharacterized protein n=1 Tax=Cerrena zonata TaxID=2478898 RepID=A0AAW0G7Q1_9APHY
MHQDPRADPLSGKLQAASSILANYQPVAAPNKCVLPSSLFLTTNSLPLCPSSSNFPTAGMKRSAGSKSVAPSSATGSTSNVPSKKTRSSASAASVSAAVMALKSTALENLKLRERKLLEDDMCKIINPKRVQCRRCGIEIQLSKKSDFDACHWNKHRERCLKKKPDNGAHNKRPRERKRMLTWPTEVRIISGARAASLASTTPSLSPDIDVDIDDHVPLSPLTSLSSGLPSPVSPAHTLALSPSPQPSHIELPKPMAPLTTTPKTETIAPSLASAPPPPIIPVLPPTSTSVPPRSLMPKSPDSPFRLDYLKLYNPELGTPLDFPPTEYCRWSQMRTSYSEPDSVRDDSAASGSVTPTATAVYPLSAACFDQPEEESYNSGFGFATSSCRFSR